MQRDTQQEPAPTTRATPMAMAGESTRATTMAGEYQDEYARVAEARAPGPEQGEDCSVPVGFLTSTFANPDLGYRIPTSASALLAHRSVDRARQLTEGPRGRQAFSMSEVDLREHARARYRVEAERRKHEVAAALELERYEREHHFLEVDGGRPHIAPPGRERPHLDRAAQKLKLRRRPVRRHRARTRKSRRRQALPAFGEGGLASGQLYRRGRVQTTDAGRRSV